MFVGTVATAREVVVKSVGEQQFGRAPQLGRVLVVDDDNGPGLALRHLLKEEYDVEVATDVASALQVVDRWQVDVIITDLRMPRCSGIELLRQVREQYPDIEVIILTGYGQLETAVKAVEYGAFVYIEKPFDNETMLRHVQAAFQKRRCELERRRLERLAFEANRFETVGRVVSGMIHDLGTPLSVIASHAELLLLDPHKANLESRLTIIRDQVAHCADIVRSTMSFLRHQGEQLMPINLSELVEACLQFSQPLLRRHNVKLTKELPKDMPTCFGDTILVRQAILNLITNACQAMEDQPNSRGLAAKTWADSGRVFLSVEDTGPGILPEEREKVFEAFYSTKGKSGTGLGLAVVRNVMQRHRGEVYLEDNVPRGVRFVLEFPSQ